MRLGLTLSCTRDSRTSTELEGSPERAEEGEGLDGRWAEERHLQQLHQPFKPANLQLKWKLLQSF